MTKYLGFMIFLLFVSCGEGLQVSKSSVVDPGDLNCPTKSNKKFFESEAYVYPEEKMAWDAFFYNQQVDEFTKSGKLKTSNTGDVVIKKDTEFVLTVNRFCMYSRIEDGLQGKYPLTKALNIVIKSTDYSEEESHLLTWDKDISLSALQALAKKDSCILMVSPNVTVQTQTLPNDPRVNEQTHLPVIKYEETYDFYNDATTGIKNDTIIAVIDNGVDINHPDIKNIVWENSSEKNGTAGVDDDGNGYIDDINGYDFATNVADPNHKYPVSSNSNVEKGNSHGSHVAGLAAAITNNSVGVAGVMAKKAKIMALNVFGNSNGAYTNNIDNAIRYAADKGAHIINMSLGGRGSTPSTESAIRYAVGKGSFVVVAAGNDSQTLTSTNFYTPASYGATINGMLTIGATDANSSQVANLCSFSNKSTTYVELGAPGCESGKSGILATIRNSKYDLLQGTSMASPVAAGVASVVWSYVRDRYSKTLTPAELEVFLKDGSKNFAQLNSTIKDGKNTDLLTLKDKILADFGSNGGGGNDGGNGDNGDNGDDCQ